MVGRRGFTVVELVVVVTIMGILLALGVVSFSGSQVHGRNAKRKADIEAIARGLESRYVRQNPYASAAYIKAGTYPSINEFRHAQGLTVNTVTPNPNTLGVYMEKILQGTSAKNFKPPGATSSDITATFKPICTTACGAAEDAGTISTALGGATNVYIYEPITLTNQVCLNNSCARFNLYYLLEGDATVQKKESKRQ